MPSRTAVSLTSSRVAKLSVPSRIRSWSASKAAALAGVMRSATVVTATWGLRLGDEGGGERGLGRADVGGAVERLALEVGEVDGVAVDDRQPADARAGERGDDGGADPARADDGDARGLEAVLPDPADLGQDDVARVAVEFVVGERHGLADAGASRSRRRRGACRRGRRLRRRRRG